MNDVTKHQDSQTKHPEAIETAGKYKNPFSKEVVADHVSHGTISIESERAIAQIKGKVFMAKEFPRDPEKCFEDTVQACKSIELAEKAFYSYPKGGGIIHGPTIKLMEELSQIWGNMEISVIELARREGETELQASAWDIERNVSSSVNFTVKHQLDKQSGPVELKSNRDIRDLAANISSRKIRGRIAAVLPESLVKAAINMCHDTLAKLVAANPGDVLGATVARLKKYGVGTDGICQKFGVQSIDALDAQQITDLKSMYLTIKANEANAFEIFEQGITRDQIAERKAKGGHAPKPAPQQEQKQKQKPAEKPDAPKDDSAPKKGTIKWFRIEIHRLGAEAVRGGKLGDLQKQYTELMESKMTADRQGSDTAPVAQPEQKTAPQQQSGQQEPPAGTVDDDLWGDDDDLFDE